MQSNISRLAENARWLKQHLDHLHLESQMQESQILETSIIEDDSTGHTNSNADSTSAALTEAERASSRLWQSCFQQGKCPCCLLTVSLHMVVGTCKHEKVFYLLYTRAPDLLLPMCMKLRIATKMYLNSHLCTYMVCVLQSMVILSIILIAIAFGTFTASITELQDFQRYIK